MQYALLIYGEEGRWETFSEAEQQAMTEDYMSISRDPKTVAGADLGELSGATTVRVDNGKTLTTDGPFAETKEYLGGLYLIEADNLDEAIEIAGKIPAARTGGAIEVRPVVEH
ncbi:MAG TPA: YciI family protein [Gaiellaceae bacterium]|nr:YciI family protein [Gaiellaceae bacterium]